MNINRDYLIILDVKSGEVDSPNIYYFNTDKNTSNLYVQMVIRETTVEVNPIENATDYSIKANIIKPDLDFKILDGTLVNEEKAIYEFNLTEECINLSGNCKIEFEVFSKVNNIEESITSFSTKFKVFPSILTDTNKPTETSSDYPILKKLIEEIEDMKNSGSISHGHNNKTVLDSITSTKVNNWDKAYTHSQSTHFSGNYNDLTNQPTIPTEYTHPITHPASMITGLADVATSGSYNDLTDKPTIPPAYTHPTTHPASIITGLSSVATSGDYNDLTNKPTIPSEYNLPVANQNTLGGIKVGAGLSITADGILSATGGGTSIDIDDTTTATNKTWSSSKIDSQIKEIANLKNSTNVVNLEKYNITQADYTTPFTVENYNTAHQNGLGFQQAINEAKEKNIQELIIPPGNYPLCYNASEKDEYNAIINSEGIDIIANGCKFYVIYDEEGINPYYSWTDEELTANNGVKDSYLLMGYVFKTDRNITGAEIVGERGYRQNKNTKYRDSSYGIILSSKCDNNIIKNCKIHHISGDGIGGGINFSDYETTPYVSGNVICTAQEMINGVSQTSEYCYLSPRLGIRYNVDTSKPLHICNTGYDYFLWTHKPIKVHCFSQTNGNTGDYLGTVTVEQGNYFYVPEKTFYVYVQVTYGSTHTSDSTVTYNFRFGNAKYYGTKIEGCDIYLNQRGGISNLPSESIVKKCTIHDNGCAYGNMVAYYDGTQFGIDIEDWYINRLTIEDSLFYGQSNDVLYRCHDLVIKNSTFNNSVSSLNYAVDLHFEHSNFYGNVSLTTPAEFGTKTAIGCEFKGNVASEINIIENVNEYTLPIANSTTLGGVMPIQKTASMTQAVGIDSQGQLYTSPTSSTSTGGSENSSDFILIKDITLAEDVPNVDITAYEDGTGLNLTEIMIYMITPKGSNEGKTGDIYINNDIKLTKRSMKISNGSYIRYGSVYCKLIAGSLLCIIQYPDSEKLYRTVSNFDGGSEMLSYNYNPSIEKITSINIKPTSATVIESGIQFKIYGR